MLNRTIPKLSALLVGALCTSFLCQTSEAAEARSARTKMGSRFEITAVHSDEATAWRAVEAAYAEIDRLEAMISSWRDSSETSAVNRGAGGEPVEVSAELLHLIGRALKVSALTDGAFDITFGGVGQLWNFKDETPELPDPKAVEAALTHVGYQRVRLDRDSGTVRLEHGMRIGFGAIGKGFAANRAARVLRERGIKAGVINAGGDLLAFGRRETGGPWTVAIADPLDRDSTFARLAVSDGAVVTSGDYESFFEIDGVRYSHILDPRTGYPVRQLRSVTILCPDAELADALATAVSVLGKERGLGLVNRLEGVEALVVDARGEIHVSEHLQSHYLPSEIGK